MDDLTHILWLATLLAGAALMIAMGRRRDQEHAEAFAGCEEE